MEKVHWSRLTRGVGPAERTGKSVTTYCPGGTRELDAVSRRLPLNPRDTNPTLEFSSVWVMPSTHWRIDQRRIRRRRMSGGECQPENLSRHLPLERTSPGP